MSVFEHTEYDDHEQVVFCRDPESGLRAIIAVHSTALGPAAGGCRMWPYRTDEEALTDVLRLSRAMSYKNALAGLRLGGGKSVIIADPANVETKTLLRAFARQVDALGGRYLTAEDVGVGIADVEVMAEVTKYVFGLTSTGDPSPFTARGAFQGVRAAVKHKLGRDSLGGLTVAVQGVGNVGYQLCKRLHENGARLVVADVHEARLQRPVAEFGAVAVGVEEIYVQDADVFAPCALGGVVNDDTLPKLKTAIVAGVANNQLAEDRHGEMLHQRGVLYAPDYVVNAGGMLNASGDIFGSYDVNKVMSRIDRIYDTAIEIFERAASEDRPPHQIADEMARRKIAAQ